MRIIAIIFCILLAACNSNPGFITNAYYDSDGTLKDPIPVSQADIIGIVQAPRVTNPTTPPHSHIEMRDSNGKLVNPLPIIFPTQQGELKR